MVDVPVRIRLRATDAQRRAAALQKSIDALRTSVDRLAPAFRQATSGARQFGTVANREMRQTREATQGIASNLRSIRTLGRTAFLGFSGAAAVRGFANLADEGTRIESLFRQVTDSTEDLVAEQENLYRLASELRVPVDSLATVFARTELALGGAFNVELVRQFTRSVTQLGVASGATGIEITNAMRQLLQGLGSGKLAGDELRGVLEGLPAVGRELAREIGVPFGMLRQLGATGALTPNIVFGALSGEGVAARAQSAFDQVGQTFEQTINIFRNQLVDGLRGNTEAVKNVDIVLNKIAAPGILAAIENIGLLALAVVGGGAITGATRIGARAFEYRRDVQATRSAAARTLGTLRSELTDERYRAHFSQYLDRVNAGGRVPSLQELASIGFNPSQAREAREQMLYLQRSRAPLTAFRRFITRSQPPRIGGEAHVISAIPDERSVRYQTLNDLRNLGGNVARPAQQVFAPVLRLLGLIGASGAAGAVGAGAIGLTEPGQQVGRRIAEGLEENGLWEDLAIDARRFYLQWVVGVPAHLIDSVGRLRDADAGYDKEAARARREFRELYGLDTRGRDPIQIRQAGVDATTALLLGDLAGVERIQGYPSRIIHDPVRRREAIEARRRAFEEREPPTLPQAERDRLARFFGGGSPFIQRNTLFGDVLRGLPDLEAWREANDRVAEEVRETWRSIWLDVGNFAREAILSFEDSTRGWLDLLQRAGALLITIGNRRALADDPSWQPSNWRSFLTAFAGASFHEGYFPSNRYDTREIPALIRANETVLTPEHVDGLARGAGGGVRIEQIFNVGNIDDAIIGAARRRGYEIAAIVQRAQRQMA